MNCRDFWKRYEEKGLTDTLQHHLDDCKSCYNEYLIESAVDRVIETQPLYSAPDHVWDKINAVIGEEPAFAPAKTPVIENIRRYIKGFFPETIRLKPALAGVFIILITTIAATFYGTTLLFPSDPASLQAKAVEDLENTEQKYLAAIDKFSQHIDESKDTIDPELYDLYMDKLAVLDEYILECTEAAEENEYNFNARKYLAMAYKEKAETLREMSGTIN